MTTTTPRNDETTVSQNGVIVRRELREVEDGVVGAIELQSTREAIVLVHVVDEFPADLPIDAVGFKHGTEPDFGDITTQGVSIKQTLTDDPVRIEYGLKLSEPVGELRFTQPTIRDMETAAFTRSAAAQTGGDEPSAVNTASPDSISSTVEAPDTATAGTVTDRKETETTFHEHASPETVERTIMQSFVQNSSDVQSVAEGNGSDESSADEVVAGGDGVDPSATPRGRASPDRSRSDEPKADSDGATRRSVEARIDLLSARVEKFGAYATALEDLIDEYGTGPEFIDRIEADLTDLDGRLQSFGEELKVVRDSYSEDIDDLTEATDAIEQRLKARQSTIDGLRNQIWNVADEVASVGGGVHDLEGAMAEHSSALHSIESDVDELAGRVARVEEESQHVRETTRAVSHDVRAMREELKSLRGEVRELTEVREALASIFDPTPGQESQTN
jgi:methyl-accepting chemotaxis protein